MKKYLIIMLLVFLVLLSGCATEAGITVTESSDCPHGEVGCEFPGGCGLYTDTDDNGICDNSE